MGSAKVKVFLSVVYGCIRDTATETITDTYKMV